MNFKETELKGIILIEPDVYKDDRGFFMETFQQERYRSGGILGPFVQDNYSNSLQGTLRGLHYQIKMPQGKLVYVTYGEVFDIAVDIRKGSPQFGKWLGFHLSSENKRQLYIPPGFAHGFCVLSKAADFIYKCTDFYSAESERGIIWNDPSLNIKWPLPSPLLSPKDQAFKTLEEMDNDLPLYGPS